MGILDTIKQIDAEQEATATLEQLISTLPAVEQQLTQLTSAVNALKSYVTEMDAVMSERLDRMSISPQPVLPSPPSFEDSTMTRLNEIERTLFAIASTLTHSQTVTLPDGESVTRSELDSYAMMTRIVTQLEMTSAASAELADAVRQRGVIRVDPGRLAAHAVGVLDDRLSQAVEAPVSRVEAVLTSFESRVATLGAQKAAEASERAERVTEKATEVAAAVTAAERRVDALSARVTWTAVGRLSLALLPLAAALLLVGGLTTGAAHALGIGPLLTWAWTSFGAATEWWQKAAIAAGTLGAIAVGAWLVHIVALRLRDAYGRW